MGNSRRDIVYHGRRKLGQRWMTAPVRLMIAGVVGVIALFIFAPPALMTTNEFTVPTINNHPVGIASGPDGALWFTDITNSQIDRITTAGLFSEFSTPTANSSPQLITAGPDGALWFTESSPGANKIGRITTAGTITEFTIPTANCFPVGITAGPDGALWFTEENISKIGRITTAGVITEFSIPTANCFPAAITAGPDGALWFTEFDPRANKIGRITTAGVIAESGIPTASSFPEEITAGPDGALWFTEENSGKIGRTMTITTITPHSNPISATEGASFSGILATFSDADTSDTNSSNFTTTINWGDGTSAAGNVTSTGSGNFSVNASHIYADEGSYPVTITIHNNANNFDVITNSTATVTDAPLAATGGKTVNAVWGKRFTAPVASFTDANVNAAASDFTATILWGDTGATTGTVTANSSGGFDVIGTYTYRGPGSYAIRVQISDKGGSGATANSTADVIPPMLSINSVSVTQGSSGTTNAVFTVTLSVATDQTVTVNYATADGTAAAGEDYVANSGTLTFNPGETSKIIIVIVNPEPREANETFSINLSNPTNALTSTALGTCTIINDNTAGSLQFSQANYNVNEGDGFATITVTRTGDTSSTVTVDYATSDGTAQQRTKYITASGTLSFAPGETSKTFTVLITDEAYVEGNQTVNLTLSNANPAAEASLGTLSTAVLTINDNDTALPTTNPIDDEKYFVHQHYYDFLSRIPDQGGWDYWTGQINACGTDARCILSRRVGVSAAYFTSQEFQDTGFFVYLFYIASYGQKPLYAQFMPDRSRVVGGANLSEGKAAFALSWVQRPAFVQQYPRALAADQFVDALIATVKTADAVDLTSQRSTLISLYDGTDNGRAAILQQVAQSQQFTQAEYNPAFVLMQYFGYLRRDPDADGYQFWLKVMNGLDKSAFQGMTCAFITSREYQERFSPVVTHSNADCGR